MSVDNPYYFYNESSQRLPEPSPSKGFSFFRRRSSSSSSNKSVKSPKSKTFNSATLNSDALYLGNRKGSLKSLLRPTNPNSHTIYSQGLVFGESQVDGCTPDKRNNLNRNRDRLGSYNESQTYSENDDVFLQNPRNLLHSTSYSDTSNGTVSSGHRRHSIGTFITRDRMRCGSVSDEVPKSNAPRPPPNIINRIRSDPKNGETCGMDDILIVTSRQSEPAILWANYLKTRFDKITKQRGRQPFNFLHIKIDEGPITSDISKRCQSTKLQIVILCSSLISLPNHFLMSQLSVILKPDIVLGILLEVPEEKILEIQKTSLPSFKKWRRCIVRNQDQSFVGNVLGIATDILGRALCQRPLCADLNNLSNKMCHSEAFTILPRKVKIGQNKVVALLNEPLLKDDWIKIKIEKTGEIIDVLNFKKRNPYTLQFMIPESCMEVSTMIEIHIEKNEKELGSRPVKCESRLRELEQILRAQDSPLEFMCHSLGISISDKNALDTYLHQTFQKNVPPNFHLLVGPPVKHKFFMHKESSSEEYPTLLHFSAKWGLENFSMQLLECPGGDSACEIRNYSGKTPAELAESSGFTKLAGTLRSFSQMNEFTTMYHYFKGISDSATSTTKVVIEKMSAELSMPKTHKTRSQNSSISPLEYMEMNSKDQLAIGPINAVTNLNYINIESESKEDELNKNLNDFKLNEEPEIMSNELKILEPAYYESTEMNKADKFSQECSDLLENCGSLNLSNESQSDYIIQPSNIPVNENIKLDDQFGDYLTHPSNKPVEEKFKYNNPGADYLIQPSNRKVLVNDSDQSHLRMNFKKKDDQKSKCGSLRRQGSDTSKSSVDDELLEIMNDFKNNVFTIQEVEQLVVAWKNRNDVQQSYKDKQEQLQKMRSEYERIQDQMQEKMKRPTPFERVKKLFSRNKANIRADTNNSETTDDPKSASHRPMSSLSLQSISSSSSGRMSTGSVCSGASLGDSGTHSDHEERRHIFANTCRVGLPGSLMDNYLIPPTPRPITTATSTPAPTDTKNRLQISNSNPNDNYSLFPSNVPVYPSQIDNHNLNHEYINFSGLNTIEETKETGIDVGPTVQSIKVKNDNNFGAIIKTPDLCSSFKPTSPIAIIEDQSVHFKNNILRNLNKTDNFDVLSKENINDMYKTINDLDINTKEKYPSILMSTSCQSNLCVDVTDSANHEYMNV